MGHEFWEKVYLNFKCLLIKFVDSFLKTYVYKLNILVQTNTHFHFTLALDNSVSKCNKLHLTNKRWNSCPFQSNLDFFEKNLFTLFYKIIKKTVLKTYLFFISIDVMKTQGYRMVRYKW